MGTKSVPKEEVEMMEDPKNGKDDEKEKESPELKKELTEDELKVVGSGLSGTAFANES